jgi:hypothetical protein
MTGDSPNATGGLTGAPTFFKQEVKSDGTLLADRYDHLVTTFGATISGYEDITGQATYGSGAVEDSLAVGTSLQTDGTLALTTDYDSVLTGTPAQLVGTTDALSLNKRFGTIMPSDDGRFKLTLSAKGIGDVATTQSGDYQITVVAQFMANEQGTKTVVASTAETGFLTDVIYYGTLNADTDDNTLWNTTTSTSTTGVEQSAAVISEAASDTDATLDEVGVY